MARFKIGDYVFTHRPNICTDFEPHWADHMDMFDGKKGKIVGVETPYASRDIVWYDIKHDEDPHGNSWNYAERWLKPIASSTSYEGVIVFQYCPVCGGRGTLGFNLFHCQTVGCNNYRK